MAPFARKSCVAATQVALAMMAVHAQAQQPAAKPGERIEVTGSRIPLQQNVESTSPISVISADDIKIEGVRNTENLLYNMPQVFADQGSTVANGASGTATVDLRNLGADRTLVLVNGRRLPAGSPTYYPTDLNQIPAPLIQRVEILTGGASAIYGSDAIAGVVNFIMRNNFSGVQAEVNYSFFNHQQDNPQGARDVLAARAATNPSQFIVPGDVDRGGESTDVNILMGDNFANGRGNATVYFGYKKDKPLTQAEYDYSACTLARGGTPTGTEFACGGSGTSFPGQFINLGNGSVFTIADAQGGVRPFVGATDQFNFGPYNYYQRPSERYTAAAMAHYDVNPSMRVYTEFNFHDDHTIAQIAPSGLFGVQTTATFENPLFSDALRTQLGLTGPGTTQQLLILRRNIEGGGRQADIRHTSFRSVVGVKGDIGGTWDYDVFAQTGKVIYQQVYRNDFSATRGGRSLDVVPDPATGAPVCRSALDGSDPNCVPYNIFSLGGVTQAALNYLQTPGLQTGETSQSVQGATLSTDLGNYGLKFPSARSGVGIAVGAERRTEKLTLDTDTAFSTGDLSGQGGPTIGLGGKYTVKEFFGEVRIPILEGVPGADILSLNASYRYSDYDTGKETDSYGLGIEYAPIRTVKIRGSYQQAVRAANVIELFQAQGTNLFDMDSDPCAGPTPARTFTECARTGVTAAQYGNILDNPAGQYNYLQGGNPLLEPETSKSYTVGIVLTPMRNLSATFDYYRIEVKDVISVLPPVTALTNCLDTGSAAFCGLINRDSLGTLWLPGSFIVGTNQNLAQVETSGYDLAVNYNHPLGRYGTLGVNFIGTYLAEYKSIDIPGTAEYDCAGLYGNVCLLPLPEWRHKLRFSWATPWNVDVSLTWRYFSEVEFDSSVGGGAPAPVDQFLKAQNYIDLAGSWAITKQLTLRAGVNNIFDKSPPLTSQVGTTGNGNTYPQTYDAFGRRVFVNATVKF
ncbi:MAG TPA: TonB-dependent receptor [Usitatibacter sp.]|nr:TonB-dependent receptor [Usitatibacter sp.]